MKSVNVINHLLFSILPSHKVAYYYCEKYYEEMKMTRTWFLIHFMAWTALGEKLKPLQYPICIKGNLFCIPQNYSKFDLPTSLTTVSLGITIVEIPKIDDHEFSVTLRGYLGVYWTEPRLIFDVKSNVSENDWISVDGDFIKELWLPDLEIYDIKEFKSQHIVSKLQGLWISPNSRIYYSMAAMMTFNCPMTFDNYPLDSQNCQFRVSLSS